MCCVIQVFSVYVGEIVCEIEHFALVPELFSVHLHAPDLV